LSCCAALRDEDLREAIAGIHCPVLCVAGNADPATPPAALQFIHERIAGSKLVLLDAAHPHQRRAGSRFTDAVLEFIPSPSR
jgi:3-oxoadipate enol-lactonase